MRITISLIGVVMAVTPVAGQVVNGGFEDGGAPLNGWTTGPGSRIEVVGSANFTPNPITPPEGTRMAILSTGPGDVPTAPGGDFDGNGVSDFDSAVLTTTFTTTAPDESLSFAWAFLTNEIGPGGQGEPFYDDLFDMTINGISIVRGSVRKPGGTSPFPDTLGYDSRRYTVSSPGLANGSDFGTAGGGLSEFKFVCLTIADPGTYTLEFLIADQGDSVFDSALLIDDVAVGAACDPTIQVTESDQAIVQLKTGGFEFREAANQAAATSADGTRLTFRSTADLLGDNPNLEQQIWLATRGAGSTFSFRRISAAVGADFGDPDISADGEWISFASTGDLLPPGNPDGNFEIFRYDMNNGTLAQITTTSGCTNGQPTINDGGGRIAFRSDCSLAASASSAEIVLWDGSFRGIDTTGCENRNPRISRDSAGRYVSFVTSCSGAYGFPNVDSSFEIVQWDTTTDLYLEVTTSAANRLNDAVSSSADGRYLSFVSDDDHEAGQNPGNASVVFRYDRATDSFLQLVDPASTQFYAATSIDPTGAFVAVEAFDLFAGGAGISLLDTAVPRTIFPVVDGGFDSFASLPALGLFQNRPQIAFLYNGDLLGTNADRNFEIWLAGPAFDLPDTPVICSSVNSAIPDRDATGVIDVITTTLPGTIDDLDIIVRIDHTQVGDIRVEVEHLDTGTDARIIDRPGRPPGAGCSGDDIDVTLDDEAADPVEDECVTPGPVAIAGSFSPNESLGAFDGETIAGDWQIQVTDRRGSNFGTFLEWCLVPSTP